MVESTPEPHREAPAVSASVRAIPFVGRRADRRCRARGRERGSFARRASTRARARARDAVADTQHAVCVERARRRLLLRRRERVERALRELHSTRRVHAEPLLHSQQ